MNKPLKVTDQEAVEGVPTDEKKCFVIMPIAEVDGYDHDHFRRVYEHIIIPACKRSGFSAHRADDVKASNFIHLDILRKIIEYPLSICDLSTRNPNVLYELGIRQAFDLPVVLIQEIGTPKIFDIGPLRYLEYSKNMRYDDVVSTQERLSEVIKETIDASQDSSNVNSLVKLLSLSQSARLPDVSRDKESMSLDLIRSEMRQMRSMVEKMASINVVPRSKHPISIELERLTSQFDSLLSVRGRADDRDLLARTNDLISEILRALRHAEGRTEAAGFRLLLDRAEAFQKGVIRAIEDEDLLE